MAAIRQFLDREITWQDAYPRLPILSDEQSILACRDIYQRNKHLDVAYKAILDHLLAETDDCVLGAVVRATALEDTFRAWPEAVALYKRTDPLLALVKVVADVRNELGDKMWSTLNTLWDTKSAMNVGNLILTTGQHDFRPDLFYVYIS